MIKTNSELPITLLNSHNETLNDFDFVLLHLYVSDPGYRKYFDQMREQHPERMMIFDNSAYEFFVKGEELFHKYAPRALSRQAERFIAILGLSGK